MIVVFCVIYANKAIGHWLRWWSLTHYPGMMFAGTLLELEKAVGLSCFNVP